MPSAPPLILLAPSEGKSPGGHPGRLKETEAQRWVRERLEELVRTGTPLAQKRAFEVKDDLLERARTEALALQGRVPLLPALERYSGVAFRASRPTGGSAWPGPWRPCPRAPSGSCCPTSMPPS